MLWYPYHSIGMESSGIQWAAIHSMACQSISFCAMATAGREKDKRVRGRFHYNLGNTINHPEVKAMPSCVACGKELEPPARAPHTNYVKSLYQLAGQTYCRHHVIKAAVAAGVIKEVRVGAGSDVVFVNSRQ